MDAELSALIARLNDMSARELTRWLTTPAQSGFYLSAEDMARVGLAIGVGISPFSRSMALEQLLRGAALDGRLDAALAGLRQAMASQLARYEQLGIPEIEHWIERGRLTLAAWTAIEAAFTAESGNDPAH